jgi:hypothetical protein
MIVRTLIVVVISLSWMTTGAPVAMTETEQEIRQWPILSSRAFSPGECDAIVNLYVTTVIAVEDTRESESVSRVNRFDAGNALLAQGRLDWIFDRVVKHLPVDEGYPASFIETGALLKKAVDFTLLHEFLSQMHFGLHVDTAPHDGTFRTYNINIMLSDPVEYSGGELQVGDSIVELRKGDVYMYPASLPHAVHPITSGLRRTFIIALRVRTDNLTQNELERQRAFYWKASEERLRALSLPANRMGTSQSKLHLIHARFLQAVGNRSEQEINEAYCRAYKATAERELYAQRFFEDGVAAQAGDDKQLSIGYFSMALCINPVHEEAIRALEQGGD